MSERLPGWFPAVITAFIGVLLFIAYEADPPMAYLIAGLLVAFFVITRIVDRAVEDEPETSEAREESQPKV
ncbi:MAG: hypothetical protein Q4G51_05575 [Dermatophilus congolensis]|nr:hypothetical protein [Dermatophilus congolensis]